MAEIIHQFTATIPANTAIATPYSSPFQMPPEQILSIDLDVPPGPSGLMGFYLAVSGQQIIPFETGEWLVWDDREKDWDLEGYPTNGRWSIVGYNLDIWPHLVTVRFHANSAVQTDPASILPSVTIVNGNSDALADVML